MMRTILIHTLGGHLVDQYLSHVDLLDCSGVPTHTLTLLLDGTVRIVFHPSGREARVAPDTRTNLTPHVPVPGPLLDAAGQLAKLT